MYHYESREDAGAFLPWLELAILLPIVGTLLVVGVRDLEERMKRAITISALTFVSTFGAWLDFSRLRSFRAHDHWNLLSRMFGSDAVVIDELSAPLLPLAAALVFADDYLDLTDEEPTFPARFDVDFRIPAAGRTQLSQPLGFDRFARTSGVTTVL